MMQGQCHCLALFLDLVPSHQVRKHLPCIGKGVHPQFLFAAVFADRAFCSTAMAYLFYPAGRQCEPGLSFALLDAGYAMQLLLRLVSANAFEGHIFGTGFLAA